MYLLKVPNSFWIFKKYFAFETVDSIFKRFLIIPESFMRLSIFFNVNWAIFWGEKSLKTSLNNDGKFEIITGLDFKTTDPKSILYFINLKKLHPNFKFYCYGDRKSNKTSIVFHPKIYLFNTGKETTSIVGSANMTGGGLLTNFEVNTIFNEKKSLLEKIRAIAM